MVKRCEQNVRCILWKFGLCILYDSNAWTTLHGLFLPWILAPYLDVRRRGRGCQHPTSANDARHFWCNFDAQGTRQLSRVLWITYYWHFILLTLCTADLVRRLFPWRLAFKMKVRQRHRGVLLRFDAEDRCLHQLGGFAQRDLRFSEQFLDSFWLILTHFDSFWLILTYSPQLPCCLASTSCGKLPWWSMMMILHVSSIFGSNPNKKKPHTNSNSPTANGLRCGLQGRRNCIKRGWESTSHLQHCA